MVMGVAAHSRFSLDRFLGSLAVFLAGLAGMHYQRLGCHGSAGFYVFGSIAEANLVVPHHGQRGIRQENASISHQKLH